MRILLISPPYCDFYFTPARIEPLGLLYVKEALQREGYASDLIDFAYPVHSSKEKMPDDFSYLGKYYHKDLSYFSLFSGYKRLGKTYREMCEAVAEYNPEVVFISANFSAYSEQAREVICAVREFSRAVIAVGGWSVTAEKEAIYGYYGADYLLYGDSEVSAVKLMQMLEGKIRLEDIPGLIYRDNESILSNGTPMGNIPDHFPVRCREYSFRGKKISKIILSRGCRNRCSFCVVHRGREFSYRSIESVEAELDYLYSTGTSIVNIEDDSLFFDASYSDELLDLLRNYHERGMSFAAMNGMNAADILPYVDRCVESGFMEFNFALVSSHKTSAAISARPFGVNAVDEAVSLIKSRRDTIVYIIAGLKGASADSVADDIRHLAKLPVTIGVSPLYSIPGVDFFEPVMPPDRKFMRGSALYSFFDGFSRDDAASAMKAARMINRIRNSDLCPEEMEENLFYFKESVKRGRWFRKTRGGWIDSFEFSMNLSEINVLTHLGEIRSIT